MACELFDWKCHAGEGAASLATNAIDRLAIAVTETLGQLMGTLATAWVRIKTPVLVGGTGGSPMRTAGEHAPGADGIETVLGWTMWVAFGIMILALIFAGVRLASMRRDPEGAVGRVGIVLLATILVSGAVGIVAAVAPAGSVQGSAPVAYLQASLYWYMLAVAAIGVVAGAVKMAWAQRADAGLDVFRSILTLAVVTGAGLAAVSLLTAAADEFAVWILDGAIGCSLDADGTCFSNAMGQLLVSSAPDVTGPTLPGLLTIILGLLAILAVIVQVVLMVIRSAMLVVLSGMLPISAAATNTAAGEQMFKKTIGWLLGMILYKPAAAVIYATAFLLVGDNTTDRSDQVMSTITGLTLIVMALIALPALMALIVPATSAVASGGGLGGTAAMAAMALPTGAAAATQRGNQTPPGAAAAGGNRSFGAGGPSGTNGGSGGPGPSGGIGPAGGAGSNGQPTRSSPGASGGAGSPGTGRAPVGAAAGSTAGGTQAAAGLAGRSAAGSASGAMASPVGMAAAAGLQAVDGARRAVNQSTNRQEGGPDGAQ